MSWLTVNSSEADSPERIARHLRNHLNGILRAELVPRTSDDRMATQLDNRKDLQPSAWLEQRFCLSLRETSLAIEFRAAVATFMVMAYIIFANASILGTLADSRAERLAFPAVLTV